MPKTRKTAAGKRTAGHVPQVQTELNALRRITMLLRTRSGNDFSHYKQSTIRRRIERRMAMHNLNDIDPYARYLSKNSAFENFSVEHDFPGIGRKNLLLNARRITGEAGVTQLILLALEERAVKNKAERNGNPVRKGA